MAEARTQQARVVLVLVSHSAQIAEGTAALAAQMAPGVQIRAVGGLPDGGLGTDFDRTLDVLGSAAEGALGVVVIADLGSAVLTVESAMEFLDEDVAGRTRLADAPFVEGTVAAAVTAHGGGDLAAVLGAAEHAGSTFASASGASGAGTDDGAPDEENVMASASTGLARQVEVRNPMGLHARPAAVLARMVASFDATLTIGGVNAASVLELMKLGAQGGQILEVDGTGPQAEQAIAAVVGAIEGGFGEV